MDEKPTDDNAAILRVTRNFQIPNLIKAESVVVKKGPDTYKTASLLYFGNKNPEKISKVILKFQSFSKNADGKYDFKTPNYTWYCENDQIALVQALLNTEFPDAGNFKLVKSESSLNKLLQQIESGSVSTETIEQIVGAFGKSDKSRGLLSGSRTGQLLSSAILMDQQHEALTKIEKVVVEGSSTETNIHALLKDQPWIFGGRFIGVANRRSLTVLDQLDIPLLRADGSLHIIELKKANIPSLIKTHRNHNIVGADVHEAVNQGANYLRSLDENRANILADLKIEARRASVTVVIGHPTFVEHFSEVDINETIRTYSSHLSRIEVMTYKQLLDGASKMIRLSD